LLPCGNPPGCIGLFPLVFSGSYRGVSVFISINKELMASSAKQLWLEVISWKHMVVVVRILGSSVCKGIYLYKSVLKTFSVL
jgi:hypothetical protein